MVVDEGLRVSSDLPGWVRKAALGVICLVLLVPATSILTHLHIYGDDNSSHQAAIHYLITLLRNGQTDFHCPTFNLGFPLYLYYQPLPHLSAALLHLMSFGLLDEALAFNLSVVVLWCLYPVTLYLGARRLGLGDTAALLGAFVAPTVSSTFPFGFTLLSYMGYGLYTQLYAMVLFPLAVGWSWYALHRSDGRGTGAVIAASGLMVLIWLSHAIYGVAAGTIAVLMCLAVPSRWRRSLPRLLCIGGLTVVTLLFWFIPLARADGYAGGWPWDSVDRWQGYGAAAVAKALVLGRVFDDRQLPVVSIAVLAGLVLAIWRSRSTAVLRFLVIGFALSLFFLMGRRTFGLLVDLQPANRGLQLFRYIGVVHFFGVVLASVGLAWLARALARPLTQLTALALCTAFLFPPMASQYTTARHLFNKLRGTEHLAEVGQAIHRAQRQGVPPGRVYAHNKTGEGTHLVAALQALYTDQPLGQSYGVSMHDTLGFYYLEYLEPLETSMLGLYNFRYVMTALGTPFAKQQTLRGNPPLLRRSDLLLYALPGAYGYFQPVDLTFAVVGAPRDIRPASLSWLRSGLPAAGRFGVVVPALQQVPRGIPTVLRVVGPAIETRVDAGWVELGAPLLPLSASTTPTGPAGQVIEESIGLNHYRALVSLSRDAAVTLKVAAHPFWEAEVDGRPAERLTLTPSFLGVQVPQGTHQVAFTFRNPSYQKLLLMGSLALWLLIPLWLLRRRRVHEAE